MWVFPAVAALVALVFSIQLGRRWVSRRRTYELLWALSLLMYAIASAVVVIGSEHGWTPSYFRLYWALGAVLNVPFLAAGEVHLMVRNRTVLVAVDLVLVFLAAYTLSVLRAAALDPLALAQHLPSGKHVFGAGTPAHRLPQLISIPSYVVLLAGALLSAWRMRANAALRDRFAGTLLIAAGATVVAGGATFAAYGQMAGFSVTLVAGISIMFAGFIRASRPSAAPKGSASPTANLSG
jgi:hypothetical protein